MSIEFKKDGVTYNLFENEADAARVGEVLSRYVPGKYIVRELGPGWVVVDHAAGVAYDAERKTPAGSSFRAKLSMWMGLMSEDENKVAMTVEVSPTWALIDVSSTEDLDESVPDGGVGLRIVAKKITHIARYRVSEV
jgi:hypothetical protein